MLESRCLLVAYYEPKMTYVCFSKSLTGSEGVRKLSSVDPKVVTFDVLGLTGRRLERKLSLNSLKDWVGVDITWHPGGSVVFFASEEGQLQCFDTALSTIQLKLAGELSNPTSSLNIGSYVRHRPILSYLSWQTSGDSLRLPASSATNCAALLFDSGPLAVLKLPLGLLTRGQLGPLELVSQYLKHTQVDEAICLLLSLDWGRLAEQCFLCLSKVANFLLRKPLDSNREAQLEAALGSFYGPAQPIPDLVVAEYGERVGHLARRFFHHLLRFEKLEKAFLLAVDLGCRDLFLHTNLTSASSHPLPGQHSAASVPNVSSGGGSASYRWPPSRAVPVTRAPEEDLIDLSDDYEDYEFTSDGIRLSVPVGVHHALPPRTVAAVVTTPTQRSVIRPIPRIVRHPPEHLETAQSLAADVYKWVLFLLTAFFGATYRRKLRRHWLPLKVSL
ncbi:hypothetical protein IscW_ISCW021937 [Ixodes scapularis]|uniref:WD repeat-containing and planar cell polarity effector protein fritz homolog n=1 Tax=Ixodes scapularis TaxID=6945 RepID=B7QG96_IXOSC|nr:hypothetical protein IscW_ISCW021937 [Ixodes scapularis]|eukprot:XP_002401354.1 hypothetical protein IscW_ISCW021937 [Ixodes scapularis]